MSYRKSDWEFGYDAGYAAGKAQGEVDAYPKIRELEREIERLKAARSQSARDVAYLDNASACLGTDMNIPSQIPGFDIDPNSGADHIHFAMMPIGVQARRAAVKWLKSQNLPCKHNSNPSYCENCNQQ